MNYCLMETKMTSEEIKELTRNAATSQERYLLEVAYQTAVLNENFSQFIENQKTYYTPITSGIEKLVTKRTPITEK